MKIVEHARATVAAAGPSSSPTCRGCRGRPGDSGARRGTYRRLGAEAGEGGHLPRQPTPAHPRRHLQAPVLRNSPQFRIGGERAPAEIEGDLPVALVVAGRTPAAGCRLSTMRIRISAAALLVKVRATTSSGILDARQQGEEALGQGLGLAGAGGRFDDVGAGPRASAAPHRRGRRSSAAVAGGLMLPDALRFQDSRAALSCALRSASRSNGSASPVAQGLLVGRSIRPGTFASRATAPML